MSVILFNFDKSSLLRLSYVSKYKFILNKLYLGKTKKNSLLYCSVIKRMGGRGKGFAINFFFKFVENVPTAIKLEGGEALIDRNYIKIFFLRLPLLDKDFPRNLAS